MTSNLPTLNPLRWLFVSITCALLLCVCGPVRVAAARETGREQYRGKSGNELSRAQVERLRKERGIKTAAEEVGTYKGAVRLDKDVVAMDLATIAERSALVVRAILESGASSVSADGTLIDTDYRFIVREVFKGSKRSEEAVALRLPLGRVEFGAGAVAEVSAVGFGGFKQGTEYLLFLTPSRETAIALSHFELAWGTQGAFELGAGGSAVPLGSSTAPVPQRYANTSRSALITETKAAIATAAKFRAQPSR